MTKMDGPGFQGTRLNAAEKPLGGACPCCERGRLDERNCCPRCGVGVPRYYDEWPDHPWRRTRGPGPNRDEESLMVEYVRTKEDA